MLTFAIALLRLLSLTTLPAHQLTKRVRLRLNLPAHLLVGITLLLLSLRSTCLRFTALLLLLGRCIPLRRARRIGRCLLCVCIASILRKLAFDRSQRFERTQWIALAPFKLAEQVAHRLVRACDRRTRA